LVGQLIKIYLVSVRKRAEQAKIFSSILNHDILIKVKEMLEDSQAEFKYRVGPNKSSERRN
jgi:hypothetical protein